MNRRSFLTRAGLLLGSIGVAESFKTDLMDRLAQTILPQAMGATPTPRRQLELCFRAGIPMMIFGTGQEFSQLSAPRYSNFSYAGNQIMKSNDVTNLYLNQDSQALMPHAANIAITQGVQNQGGHTGMFNFREGGQGRGRTTPIVELANVNPTGSIIHGVKWPGNASNRPNDKRDLVMLNNNAAFTSLFTNPKLRLEGAELNSVLAAAQKLSRRQAIMLDSKLQNAVLQSDSHSKASQMFAADYSQLLATTGMATALTATNSYRNERQALAQSLKAMANNLINSSMVVIDIGDWHGYQTDKQNANIIREMSSIIASVVDYLKATPEPTNPSLKLWDTTTIVAGSEFTRGIGKFNVDNSDGGTQGIMLIGKNVKGNYYGGFTLSDMATQDYGMAHGFDRLTGNVTMGQKNTTEQLYFTVKALSGLALSTTEREKVLTCMVG